MICVCTALFNKTSSLLLPGNDLLARGLLMQVHFYLSFSPHCTPFILWSKDRTQGASKTRLYTFVNQDPRPKTHAHKKANQITSRGFGTAAKRGRSWCDNINKTSRSSSTRNALRFNFDYLDFGYVVLSVTI
jgi:hypothetical protein